jgi:hypothetical protein
MFSLTRTWGLGRPPTTRVEERGGTPGALRSARVNWEVAQTLSQPIKVRSVSSSGRHILSMGFLSKGMMITSIVPVDVAGDRYYLGIINERPGYAVMFLTPKDPSDGNVEYEIFAAASMEEGMLHYQYYEAAKEKRGMGLSNFICRAVWEFFERPSDIRFDKIETINSAYRLFQRLRREHDLWPDVTNSPEARRFYDDVYGEDRVSSIKVYPNTEAIEMGLAAGLNAIAPAAFDVIVKLISRQ